MSRPEYLDTVLVRFENGKYSANGGSPAVMAVLRGLNAHINYESIKRLQAMTAGIEPSGKFLISSGIHPIVKEMLPSSFSSPPLNFKY